MALQTSEAEIGLLVFLSGHYQVTHDPVDMVSRETFNNFFISFCEGHGYACTTMHRVDQVLGRMGILTGVMDDIEETQYGYAGLVCDSQVIPSMPTAETSDAKGPRRLLPQRRAKKKTMLKEKGATTKMNIRVSHTLQYQMQKGLAEFLLMHYQVTGRLDDMVSLADLHLQYKKFCTAWNCSLATPVNVTTFLGRLGVRHSGKVGRKYVRNLVLSGIKELEHTITQVRGIKDNIPKAVTFMAESEHDDMAFPSTSGTGCVDNPSSQRTYDDDHNESNFSDIIVASIGIPPP